MQPKPSIGRIVHFYPNGSTSPEAAIVIAVWGDECINVQACNSGGTWHSESSVQFGAADDTSRARWTWPERV